MTRRADLDATLAAIDATLNDYKADRREQWIEENLNQPGQFYVPIGHYDFFEQWVDGLIGDKEAQVIADSHTRYAETQRKASAGQGACWYCGDWVIASGVEMHEFCGAEWERAIGRVEPLGDPEGTGFSIILRSDGTGWSALDGHPPSADLLVDGVGLSVGPFARQMARLK